MTTNRDICKAKRQEEKSKLLERVPVALRKRYATDIRKATHTSIYMPHQGEQACARRRRQLKRGIIKVN